MFQWFFILCDPKTIPLRMKVTDYVLIMYVALERNTQNDEMDLRVCVGVDSV